MIVRRPSASQLGKALACPRSCWAPESELAPEGPQNEAAAKGTRLHAGLERHVLGARRGDVLACVLPEEEAELLKAIDHLPKGEPLFEEWPMAEVECWLEPMGRRAVRGIKAACHHGTPAVPPPPGYFRGTADFLGLDAEGRPCVRDYKTGNPRNLGPVSTSAQLYFFAGWLATHPRTAPLVLEKGVRLELYVTQLAGTPEAHPSFVATNTQVEKFMQELQDFAELLELVETEGEAAVKIYPGQKDLGASCEERFCPILSHRPLTRRAAKRVGLA